MKLKVAIFEACDGRSSLGPTIGVERLEDKINDFLAEHSDHVIDIKYQYTGSSCSAMIIYKDSENFEQDIKDSN